MLRSDGHDVYDFRHPRQYEAATAAGGIVQEEGFHWSSIDPSWKSWDPESFRTALAHPIAQRGFNKDASALNDCDACILLLPCGKSAHLELGWAAGRGLPVAIVILEPTEPELMYRFARVLTSFQEMRAWAKKVEEGL